ncbi:MAG TPA: O-antigen ligase family protein [Gaiellaceae bacterium]|jgi:putative inorganic carbon (hco3(-)) transporter
MSHNDLAYVAAVLGALACFPVLLGGNRVILSGLALLAAAEVWMAFALVPGHDLKLLVTSPMRAAALVGAGLVVLGITFLFNRHPGVAPVALLIAAPFRIGVSLGSQYARLLLPLYGVLAAATLALAWRLFRNGPARRIDRSLAVPSAVLICLYSLSLLWARDVRAGSIELAAFLFPFLALVAVVVHEPSRPWLPRALVFVLIGEAVFFSAFGLWEEATYHVYFSRKLAVSNTFTSYFRTNSLFSDPNIYGRHLALALSVLVVLMWQRRRLLALAALVAFIWVGLYYSYSLSSLAALLVVVVGITLVSAGQRTRRAVAICAAVLAIVGLGVAAVGVRGHSLRNVTSGRSHLASITFDVFRHHPLAGVGVGSQPLAAQDESVSRNSIKKDTSHTTPLTVAAELGVIGLAAYLAWLAGAYVTLRKAWKREAAIGLSLAAIFAVLFVHSLSYSGFFEDPITWGTLALAAAYLPRAAPTE